MDNRQELIEEIKKMDDISLSTLKIVAESLLIRKEVEEIVKEQFEKKHG